jgi:hypothetical protein
MHNGKIDTVGEFGKRLGKVEILELTEISFLEKDAEAFIRLMGIQ